MVVRGIEFENRVKEQKVETHLVEGGHSLFNFFKAEPFEKKVWETLTQMVVVVFYKVFLQKTNLQACIL